MMYCFLVAALLVCAVSGGCAPKAADPALEQTPEPAAPIEQIHTVHDDDAVIPFYTESEGPTERRFLTEPTKPAVSEPALTDAKDASAAQAANAGDAPRKTSMPSRDPSGKKSARVGGVRKAVPVDRAAAALFGKWRVDTAQSSSGFVEADSILFLADGRMRTWKAGVIEDGRWTWTAESGIKTGGIDGVPISLGNFEVVAGTMTISIDEQTRVALTPDRIFVAPAPFLSPPAAP